MFLVLRPTCTWHEMRKDNRQCGPKFHVAAKTPTGTNFKLGDLKREPRRNRLDLRDSQGHVWGN